MVSILVESSFSNLSQAPYQEYSGLMIWLPLGAILKICYGIKTPKYAKVVISFLNSSPLIKAKNEQEESNRKFDFIDSLIWKFCDPEKIVIYPF